MSDRFDEIGYALEEEDACWAALVQVGLKPGANEKKIRFEFVTTVVDLTEGPVRPGTVLYVGPMQGTLEGIEKAFRAAAKLYDPSDDALKMHLDDQMPERTTGGTAYTPQSDGEWADLAHAQTTTKMSCAEDPTDESTVAADQRPYAFGRLLDVALAAVQRAKNRPVNRMITDMQKMGAPKNRTIRLAVWKLLEIFERETGIKPVVSANSYADDGITGNACAFLVTALAPANLVERTVLGSNILAAYREWIDARRQRP
jgi:hypothetical protein